MTTRGIPAGWIRCRLGEQLTLQRGYDITKGAAVPGDVPVISSGGVSFYHNVAMANGPGVLLGRKGSVGSVHYSHDRFWPHDTTLFVKEFRGNNPRFVYHFFKQFPIQRFEASSANPSLNRNNLHPVEVLWPPLPEQKRIAAILDKADEIRRKRQEAIKLTEELLRSAFLEMFGDPVTNPKGWEVRTLGDVIAEAQYGTSQKANEDGRGLPILRMNNITYRGEWDLSSVKWCEIPEAEREKYTTRRGDLLFNRTNSPELVGKTAVWNRDQHFAIAGYLIRVRFNERARPEYVSAFLNSAHGKKLLFEKAKPSNNMSNFSASELRRLEVPISL